MDTIIEFSVPDPGQRGAAGSGSIRQLCFVDPTTPDNFAPGRRLVKAALLLSDFALGLVEAFTFHWIRGTAIRTDAAAMA